MTPKEKAEQIVNSYELVLRPLFGINDYAEKYYHKKCALIAVNEIIKTLPKNEYLEDRGEMVENRELFYWKQVKTEIENL